MPSTRVLDRFSSRFLLITAVWCLLAAVSSAQGTLPHNIPDFSTDPSRPNVRSVQSGDWSSPSTWTGGQTTDR